MRSWGPEQEDPQERKRSFHGVPCLREIVNPPWPWLAACPWGRFPPALPPSPLLQVDVLSWMKFKSSSCLRDRSSRAHVWSLFCRQRKYRNHPPWSDFLWENSHVSLTGAGTGADTSSPLTLSSGKESHLCHFPAICPWEIYLSSKCQFPHLLTGVTRFTPRVVVGTKGGCISKKLRRTHGT